MNIINAAKYVLVKRDLTDGRVYTTHVYTDVELVLHVRGTVEATEHEILSVMNIRQEQST